MYVGRAFGGQCVDSGSCERYQTHSPGPAHQRVEVSGEEDHPDGLSQLSTGMQVCMYVCMYGRP